MSDNNPSISIIMPVYKVENYVGRAIESILSQTFSDFEFIMVNDGSPDNCGQICDAYAEKDRRLHVIHKENGGAPSARNMAIPMAKGKYFYFMDADDWCEPTMLEDMFTLAEKHQAQLVISGYYIDTYYNDTDFITQNQHYKDIVYPNQHAFRTDAHQLFDLNLLYTPWNKLYRADYILDHNILFPATFWDDFPFNLMVIRDIANVVVTAKQYYHFIRARAESETAKYNPNMYQKREEEHKWMLELYEYWGINSFESREMIARRYVERVVGCIENITNPRCRLSKAKKLSEIKKIIENPQVKEMIAVCQPHSIMMRVLLLPVRTKNAIAAYQMSRFVSYVKRKNVRLFATLKARR